LVALVSPRGIIVGMSHAKLLPVAFEKPYLTLETSFIAAGSAFARPRMSIGHGAKRGDSIGVYRPQSEPRSTHQYVGCFRLKETMALIWSGGIE
jgi:hypothetical protein